MATPRKPKSAPTGSPETAPIADEPLHRSPADALCALVRRLSLLDPVSAPPESVPPGFLAEDVTFLSPTESSTSPGRALRASRNGYALEHRLPAGTTCRVAGTLTPSATLDPWGRPHSGAPSAASDLPTVWRVETGALLPPGTTCVLPLGGATIVGSAEVRIDRALPERHGVHDLASVARAPAFPRGTFVDGRVRAVLVASGVPQVQVRPPFTVGFAPVGDELVDPAAAAASSAWPDLLGLALEEGIRSLGLIPLPLGILGDSPRELELALFRARERRADVVILAGGLGDGVTDRVAETLRRVDAEIFERSCLFGSGSSFVHARYQRLDVLALSGRPLMAAAELDAIVRPALLARLGARRSAWDWTRARWPLELEAPRGEADAEGVWRVFPARLESSPEGPLRVRAWAAPTHLAPAVPGQEAWALVPPAGPSRGARRGRSPSRGELAHYVPLSRPPAGFS